MTPPRRTRLAAAAVVSLALAGCTTSRNLSLCAALGGESSDCDGGTGEHPAGWADPTSPSFHQHYLRANGDDLAACASCHGADYQGGIVGVSCITQGCHTQPGGPEFCGTCHGGPNGPLPLDAAHALHATFCNDCHDVPKTFAQPGHITGTTRVAFTGLAVADGGTASFDAASMTCSNVYCHVSQTPVWQAPPAVIGCGLCHTSPPSSHAAWARVSTPPASATPAAVAAVCVTCHLVPVPGAIPAPGDTHVNGRVDFQPNLACDTCHGHDPTGAPGPALDGSTAPSSRGVGAHQAHLDPSFPNRMGAVVACSTCHTVPASVTDPGHLDHPLPATVSLPQNGTYDATTQGCTVWCHWGAGAGTPPVWTDVSGDITAPTCTACHGFPPLLMRDGTPHTHAQPVLSACQACHPFSATTHVDGLVELLP